MPTTLTTRQLNRTLLQRQLLLERSDHSPYDAISHLAGMQAQIPDPPYIGLWTRLQSFERDDLTRLMEKKRVVRTPMMRFTLHLITDEDHHLFRPTLAPMLEKVCSKKVREMDRGEITAHAYPFLKDTTRTPAEVREHMQEKFPDKDPYILFEAVRTYLPIVQVPPSGTWGVGTRSSYIAAQDYIGPYGEPDLAALLCRYLQAYGPASIMDFQFWTRMTGLKGKINKIKDQFTVYEDETGTELLDLPDATLADENIPAPVRLIPEYDNLIIAHRDRTRILPDEHYKKVFLSAARVLPTVLVDGFVAGTWRVDREGDTATLTITPFHAFKDKTRAALVAEGQSLTRFIQENVQSVKVAFDS